MRTVGLTFHEDTQAAPAVEAGASLPEAGTAAPEAGAQNPAPAPAPENAAAHGIDVTGAAKKQDLLLAVQTAVEPSAEPTGAVPGEQPETAAE